MPVSDRTYSSWKVRSVRPSRLRTVPSQQPTKPSGIETMPGFSSGHGEPSESGPGHTPGLRTISPIELTTPNSTPVTAPAVVNRRQVSASSSAGKFALAATAKGQADHERHVQARAAHD